MRRIGRERKSDRGRERDAASEGQRARLVRNVRADASVSPPRVTGEYSFIKLGTRGVRARGLRRAAARSAVASCDRSVVGSQVFFVSLSHVPFSSVVDLARSSRLVLARAYAPSSLSLVLLFPSPR